MVEGFFLGLYTVFAKVLDLAFATAIVIITARYMGVNL